MMENRLPPLQLFQCIPKFASNFILNGRHWHSLGKARACRFMAFSNGAHQ